MREKQNVARPKRGTLGQDGGMGRSVAEETFLYRKERFNLFWFRSDRGGREKRRMVRGKLGDACRRNRRKARGGKGTFTR